jgi:hypothetical protein
MHAKALGDVTVAEPYEITLRNHRRNTSESLVEKSNKGPT